MGAPGVAVTPGFSTSDVASVCSSTLVAQPNSSSTLKCAVLAAVVARRLLAVRPLSIPRPPKPKMQPLPTSNTVRSPDDRVGKHSQPKNSQYTRYNHATHHQSQLLTARVVMLQRTTRIVVPQLTTKNGSVTNSQPRMFVLRLTTKEWLCHKGWESEYRLARILRHCFVFPVSSDPKTKSLHGSKSASMIGGCPITTL